MYTGDGCAEAAGFEHYEIRTSPGRGAAAGTTRSTGPTTPISASAWVRPATSRAGAN